MSARGQTQAVRPAGLSAAATIDASRGRSFYLTLEPDPAFAVAHVPPAGAASGTGVLFSPAFGWDELCSHRSLWRWADALAADGHAALRVDLPGTGDSAGSPRDHGRLDAWTDTVRAGADWLRGNAGCDRVAVVGIGLGGVLAVRAVAGGAAIDDMVLWSVPARGNTLVREMRAFAHMAAGEVAASESRPQARDDDGSLEVAGFVLSAETLADLAQLDLSTLALPGGQRRRVLLLGRDAIPPDDRLRQALERNDVEVRIANGVGYGSMMTHPQLAEAPVELVAQVGDWLAEPAGDRARPASPSVPTSVEVLLRIGDATIRETPFTVEFRGQRLNGILAQPVSAAEAPVSVVLLNAGAVRRIGPSRMWVECGRRWAAAGVTSLRLDGAGLGDSDGDERGYQRSAQFYRHELANQVIAAMDELEAGGFPTHFLVGGLCSGAYWGFHAALTDERVRGLILINLWTFFWSEEMAAARDVRRARMLLRAGAWRDVARIAVSEGRIGRLARTKLRNIARPRRRGPVLAQPDTAVDDALDNLRDGDVQVLLLLSEGEALLDELVAEARIERFDEWPNLRFERIPIKDHIFRPVWAQEHVHRRLDAALERALDAARQDA